MNVYFRADVSRAIGTGHLVRCRSLARELARKGHTATFLVKQSEAHWEQRGGDAFPTRELDEDERVGGRALVDTLVEGPNPVLVTDTESGYYADAVFQKEAVSRGLGLVRFAFRPLPFEYAQIVLNPNFLAPRQTYNHGATTTLLLGLRYCLIAGSFLKAGQPAAEVPTSAGTRLLLAFGGADHQNLSLRVYRLLQNSFRSIAIVVGPLYEHRQELEAAASQESGHRVFFNTARMPEIMANVNLAITSCGSTLWELCFMGVPRIAVSTSDRERVTGEGLEAERLAVYAGHHDAADLEERLLRELEAILGNPDRTLAQIALGQELVDGRGLERVVSELQKKFS